MATAGGGNNKLAAHKSTSMRRKHKIKKFNKSFHPPPNHQQLPPQHHHNNSITQLIPLLASAISASHSFLRHQDLHLLPSQSLSLESLLSSTSLSLSKLLSVLSLSLPSLSPPLSPPPTHCWFQRFLSAASDDYDTRWTDCFRMSKPSFILLLRLLSSSLSTLFPLPPNYALAAALFRLSHGASYKAVSRRFGIDSPTACRAFYTVCKAINDNLGHLFEFQSDINRIIAGFRWISLPNCCGVLGFERFEVDSELLGENGSLLVQALVDSEGRFLDVYAGWPSTVKPESILRESKLFYGIEDSGELLNGPSFQLTDGISIPQYILGESCFPLLPWLLTPYFDSDGESNLGSSEKTFNLVHRRGMEVVGTAFARVRMRWQLLLNRWKEEFIEAFPFVFITCCLLHNFLIKCSEPFPDDNVGCSGDQQFAVYEGEMDENGQMIRNALASSLSRVSQRR